MCIFLFSSIWPESNLDNASENLPDWRLSQRRQHTNPHCTFQIYVTKNVQDSQNMLLCSTLSYQIPLSYNMHDYFWEVMYIKSRKWDISAFQQTFDFQASGLGFESKKRSHLYREFLTSLSHKQKGGNQPTSATGPSTLDPTHTAETHTPTVCGATQAELKLSVFPWVWGKSADELVWFVAIDFLKPSAQIWPWQTFPWQRGVKNWSLI